MQVSGAPHPPHEESQRVMRWAHSLVSCFMTDSSGAVSFQILTAAEGQGEPREGLWCVGDLRGPMGPDPRGGVHYFSVLYKHSSRLSDR